MNEIFKPAMESLSRKTRRRLLQEQMRRRNVVNDIGTGLRLTADTTRSPSDSIWANAPVAEVLANPGRGLYFFDDFQDFPLIGTQTTEINHGKYKVFASSGSSLSRVSAVNSVELQGGCLQAAIDTDNDSVSLAQSYTSYLLSGLSSNTGKLFFECCYAQASVATNMASVFIGLAEVDLWTLAAAVPLNAGNAITNDASAIGFRIEEDGLGVIDTVYSDRATSFTNIGDTEGGTLVANTFKKLGMVYDPLNTSECITFFADGLPLTTKLSRSTLTGLTNLDANPLGLLWSSCADSAGTSFKGYMKWWRVLQLFA